MAAENEEITRFLAAIQSGRSDAMDALIPMVYDRLRSIAAAHLSRERASATLQPTALVHELYFTLLDQRNPGWISRAHFFATASMLMRRLIVDHARRNAAAKRGSNQVVTLEQGLHVPTGSSAEILRLHEALEVLERMEPRQARIVEMRFFGGLSVEETAEVLDVSPATVKRDWSIARAWLHSELTS
ncbi:MAG TPA: ECF-type sigma factor [Gemmatimonadaceae bacterium]|nr:ECF-type sigma factor [Gemmatimonadaceae bacterium]